MAPDASTQQEIQAQAGKLLTHVAGLVGARTIEMGLRNGLIEALAKHPDGIDRATLAREANVDPFYTEVWCRAAFGAEVIEAAGEGQYRLAPHLDTLLLNQDFPGWIGGLFGIMVQPEIFDRFAANLRSGEHIWWDQVSPDFIQGVAGTSRPVLHADARRRHCASSGSRRPAQRGYERARACMRHVQRPVALRSGLSALDVRGPRRRPALTRPGCRGAAGRGRRGPCLAHAEHVRGPRPRRSVDLVWINVSMHECRDIERVTANVHNALKAGGQFVISDFPFPDSDEGLRTTPARVMSGIQFFEALIDDQLLPTQAFVDLLGRHGFQNVGSFDLAPVHAVTYGEK